MKKILVLLICLCAFATTTFAQRGESSLGANLNFSNERNIGIGVKYRYSFTDNWRIEPVFNYYFKHDYVSMWDLGANMHYVIPVASKISVYPLAGLEYANTKLHFSDLGEYWKSTNDGQIAINLGAGVDFEIASNVTLDLGLKYQIIDNWNQLVFNAGISFAF
ncbi:porin family protein [uncultured Bacteroides sp.]|uniref:porin family protein n=1 Tax=uncultured Bacteroides sp. TaxID=162156 RepID=UPI0025EBBC90|nr:porin family protein [uncultured Bacteroides sp.]